MTYHVYSTIATDVAYAQGAVLIKGGAGVATKNLITPRGVATTISDEEHALLVADQVFQLHRDNGFVTIEQGRKREAEAAAANMSAADPSRPLEPADIELDKDAPPTAVSSGPGKKAKGG